MALVARRVNSSKAAGGSLVLDGHLGLADSLPDFIGVKGRDIAAALADRNRPGPTLPSLTDFYSNSFAARH